MLSSFTAVFLSVNTLVCSFLHDNPSPYAQMCCGSHAWCLLCVKLLERPHTEKPHLSSPLPLSHHLYIEGKQSLYNNNSAGPGLRSNEIFLRRKMLSCCSEDVQLAQDKQNRHRTGTQQTGMSPGCSSGMFDHKSRLMDFTPVWRSRESVAVLALSPKELRGIQILSTQGRDWNIRENDGSKWLPLTGVLLFYCFLFQTHPIFLIQASAFKISQ